MDLHDSLFQILEFVRRCQFDFLGQLSAFNVRFGADLKWFHSMLRSDWSIHNLVHEKEFLDLLEKIRFFIFHFRSTF